MRKLISAFSVLLLLAALTGTTVLAKSEYVASFTAAYPATSGTALASCSPCHGSTMALNAYGKDLGAAKMNYQSVESKDSDGDGATNLAEIQALTNPGDASSKPAAPPSGGSTGGASGAAAPAAPAAPTSFRDTAGHPASASIETLVKAGVVKAGGNYRPNATVKRSEFATMLQRLFGLPGTNSYMAQFTDVGKGHWAYATIEAIVRSGLMTGSGTGTFGPNDGVTRGVAARAVATGLGYGKDVASASDSEALAYAVKLGLFPAGTSNAGASMTRGDAAALVAKALTAKGKMDDPLAGIANYVTGPQACATCHSETAGNMQTTAHSMMSREFVPGSTSANFNDPKAGIKASDVKLVLGSMGSNYFIDKNLNILPAVWNLETKSWSPYKVMPWTGSCIGCHTTGWDKNTKTFVALSVTCESCHGTGAKHIATGGDASEIKVSLDVDTCQPCHSAQPTQLKATGHYTVFADFIQQSSYKDSCTGCHSATVRTAKEAGETPPTLADFKTGDLQSDRTGITCVVCHDSHKREHESQLREDTQETCIGCHTAQLTTATFTAGKAVHHPQKEMWQGIGALGVESMPAAKAAECVDCHMTNGNHLFQAGDPKITLTVKGKPTEFDSCSSCHSGLTKEEVEGTRAELAAMLTEAKSLLTSVDNYLALRKAMGADVTAIKALRDKAYTNITFAEADASGGIHNPAYYRAMLKVAREWLQEAMVR